ncbi:MAG: type II toxin-antitoxin system prevent-host-death family antitoxin [Alphaproteobacteria bacterium]|nr:type II toxin-antitoxin system prevent-host-death family antitoxin [Alphaproteobacteria bacterium]
MKHQVISRDGKPAFVVIPIEEWRQISATLEDRSDTAAVRAFLGSTQATFPDAVVKAILDGAHPIRAFREYRGITQAELASQIGSSAAYISQLERGVRHAGYRLRKKLGSALKIEAGLLEADRS